MKNMTDITLILDDSGSMLSIAKPTVIGINRFLREQRVIPEPAIFSLVRFHEPDRMFWQIRQMSLESMGDLKMDSYNPSGRHTALYDSASKIIDQIGTRLAATPEDQRPNKVLIAIVTDGINNVYSGFTESDLRRRIEHQRTIYRWEFIYLGANQDAPVEARKIAIPMSNSMSYSHDASGTARAYQNLAKATSDYRSGNAILMPK